MYVNDRRFTFFSNIFCREQRMFFIVIEENAHYKDVYLIFNQNKFPTMRLKGHSFACQYELTTLRLIIAVQNLSRKQRKAE